MKAFPVLVPIILGVFFVLLGWGLVMLQRKKKADQLPKATGEVYVPKHEGDVPGWDR